ncbi:unnamed protein product [Allacma fusca]|uniref:Uncharacterized protein n=1 Tax=Allacma fusca TaxID=39272 RepID=A0A8J2LBQ1_9HEXA|nr:unnamed protein product [Allacma fusca]
MSCGNSDIDGVPLHLNRKYYPIPRAKFKDIEFRIPQDALDVEYDFKGERQALLSCEHYEKEKKEKGARDEELRRRMEQKAKASAEAAAERAAALVREYEEELAKQTRISREILANHVVQEAVEAPDETIRTGSTSYDGSSTPAVIRSENSNPPESTSYPRVIQPEPVKAPASGNYPHVIQPESFKPTESASYPQIIQPEPLKPYHPSRYSTPSVRTPAASINLSDFESDTANPFDNVELKSINDMAVLATVLQNNVSCSVPHNFNHNGEQHRATTVSTNINVNSVNGAVHQPMPYYSSYLSQNSNSYNPHQWTPTSHNPFYSQYTTTMVTAGTTVGTSASSNSIPIQHPATSSMPITRPQPTQQNNTTPYPTSVISPIKLNHDLRIQIGNFLELLIELLVFI